MTDPGAGTKGRRRVIRAPNHLGDVVMALPAVAADGSDVLVRRWLAPLLEMADLPGHILPFDGGLGGWRTAVAMLRREHFAAGTLLAPSFSAAWLLRWGGVSRLRGTATDGRTLLLSEAIPREALRDRHRINQYKLLLGQDADTPALNHPLTPPAPAVEAWAERLHADDGPVVGFFPGSNAPARRWPAERFGSVARTLVKRGARVVVLGGAGERDLTHTVAEAAEGGVDAGGATDLPGLAAVLSLCHLVITNDTGPMHLAGAVGTPTLTLWGSSDPAEVCPVGARDVRVTGPDLPCKPCFKNHCPRKGAGTILSHAFEECMNLITERQVLDAADTLLTGDQR